MLGRTELFLPENETTTLAILTGAQYIAIALWTDLDASCCHTSLAERRRKRVALKAVLCGGCREMGAQGSWVWFGHWRTTAFTDLPMRRVIAPTNRTL
jgi:hypothetical protein